MNLSKATLLLLAFAAPLSARAANADMVRVSGPSRHTLAPEIATGPRGEIAVIYLDKDPAPSSRGSPRGGPAPNAAGDSHAGMQHGSGAAPDRHLSSMDLYFARSTDGGRKFSKPVRVNREPGQVWGFAVSKPKIAIGSSGTVHVVYPANAVSSAVGKSTLVMYYARSTDGGRHFEVPRRLHQVPDIDQSAFMDGGFTSAHAFGTVGVAPDGGVHAIWVDTREWVRDPGAGSAYYSKSVDDGRTWSTEVAALPIDVCPCCQITLAFDAASNIYVGARQVTDNGQRNSSIGRIPAGGSKVVTRSRMAQIPWNLEGCPLKPTVVAVDGSTVYAAAYHGGEAPAGVYASVSIDGGATFGKEFAVHPEAAVSDAPAILLAGDRAVLAWHAKTSGTRRVFWRALGGSLEALGPLHELASPAGTAQAPALAARPDGRVQIVWQQGEEIFTAAIDPGGDLRAAR